MKIYAILLFALLSLPVKAKSPAVTDSAGTARFLSAGFSAVAYKGSLQSSYLRWTPAYQAGMLMERRKLLSGYFGIGFGAYTGEDRSYRLPAKADQNLQPAAAFEGSFFTLHYEARFLLFRYRGFRVQACQGIGLFRFTVKDREGSRLSEKPRSRASGEEYSQNSFFFPTSVMLQYRFKNNIGLGFQAGWFNNSSAYLDNMSQLSLNENRDNLAACRFHFFLPLH
jgi:hypothetical protein